MITDERVRAAAYVEAGLAAVRLLNQLVEQAPLRSDTKIIREEIARIEQVFKADGPASGFRRTA
jgi:hypothetical protein